MAFGLGSLGALCLLSIPAALPLVILPTKIRVPLSRLLISKTAGIYLWLLKSFCGVRLNDSILDSIPNDKPVILVANHPSLLDAVIVLSRLPNTACIMKASLRRNFMFGTMTRLSGYISNRDPKEMIDQACDELTAGANILLFPEGTRTKNPPVNKFSQTTAFIAIRSKVSVQTVFIRFSSLYLGKAWPIWKKPSLPLDIDLQLGQAFASVENRVTFTETLESYYRDNLTTNARG